MTWHAGFITYAAAAWTAFADVDIVFNQAVDMQFKKKQKKLFKPTLQEVVKAEQIHGYNSRRVEKIGPGPKTVTKPHES